MSLFTYEEICEGCKFANWHICPYCYYTEPKFCHCEIHAESNLSHISKTCKYKKEVEGNDINLFPEALRVREK